MTGPAEAAIIDALEHLFASGPDGASCLYEQFDSLQLLELQEELTTRGWLVPEDLTIEDLESVESLGRRLSVKSDE